MFEALANKYWRNFRYTDTLDEILQNYFIFMNHISKKVFQSETSMCKKLALDNGNKCNWGECDKCGVIPLLHKLYEGKFLEDKTEIRNAKNKIIS